MPTIYNIRYRLSGSIEWSYMLSIGSEKNVKRDAATLKQFGFEEVEIGSFTVDE